MMHRAVLKQQATDALSRLPTAGVQKIELEEKLSGMDLLRAREFSKTKHFKKHQKKNKNAMTKNSRQYIDERPTISDFIIA